MDGVGIMTQNVSRSQLGDERRGGSIASLRIQVHFEKPTILILTEVSESQNFTGKNVFKAELGTRYFFPGTLIANSLFLDHGSLLLNP